MTELTYLDNNSTTVAPPEVVDTMVLWMNRGDPSAEYAAAREARKMMRQFRRYIAAEGGFELEGPRGYVILFTSGGSEGNCHVVTAAARAYAARTRKLPHIITSAVEHKSLLTCCLQLARDRLIQLTVLPVRTCVPVRGGANSRVSADTGTVDPEELQRAIRPNTCLVTIMAANNETGAINDLKALGAVAHAAHVPFHTDAVQLFGRSTVRPVDLNLDAYTASFHKLHGPPGVGLLALRNDFVDGYGLRAFVCGAQNEGLRGGTENLPGIAGAFAAYKLAVSERGNKNRKTRHLRDGIQAALAKRFPAIHVADYCEARPRISDGDAGTPRSSRVSGDPQTKKGSALARRLDAAADDDSPVIVWIGPADRAKVLPNTLFFAVLRPGSGGRGFSNQKARAALERKGIIVSTGSTSGEPSHVIDALDIPPELWPGVLRVSLSDYTTAEEAAAFVSRFAEIVSSAEVV